MELAQAKQSIARLGRNNKALSGAFKKSVSIKVAAALALTTHLEAETTSLASQLDKLEKLKLTTLTAGIKGRFAALCKSGQMTKKEFDAMDVASLAKMEMPAITAVLGAYESREASTDVKQFGQAGTAALGGKIGNLKTMKEAIKLQKSGKGGTVNLMDGEEEEELMDGDDPKGEEETPDINIDFKALQETIKQIEEMQQPIKDSQDLLKKLKETVDNLNSEIEVVEEQE